MILNLAGRWQVSDDEGQYSFVGNVPGTIQGDLVQQGLMPHPYVGINELTMRDLENKSWTCVTEFELDDVPTEANVDLVFEGVDTLADVQLNGRSLGSTEDMFLEYRFDVRNVLRRGKNILSARIKSPVAGPAALEQEYGKLGAVEESVRAYIRKAQYSYGWDWGLRLPTSGIWRPVYVESYDKARLTGCTAFLDGQEDGAGTVRVSGYVVPGVDFGDAGNYTVAVRVDDALVGEFPVQHVGEELSFEGVFSLQGVHLWYPNGLGDHYLYAFEFTLKVDGVPVCSEKEKIGLRTVKLTREQDAEGESFVFTVNGKRVFAKGANWIPADSILSWIQPEDYSRLLHMAAGANMNMLRVWGGGIYENKQFYALCDELGIMVWQDFMFACAEYPDHLEWFRRLCSMEVREAVRKLRHHASIVLWCGNNENNMGFDEWPMMAHKVDGEYLGNRLYLHDFPMICAHEDPSRPYWPSSPYGGDKANSADCGDRHVWNVWSGWEDYPIYADETGRFISEFGFQSAPDAKTIDFFATRQEQSIFSPVTLSHNKKEEGQQRILHFIDAHFGQTTDFGAFAYLSQLDQAEAVKFGVEHWRARKYWTAGTLYWQFNDSWPVFSWSSVDYFKRPKALYYYTKRFYADIVPIIRYEPSINTASVTVVNDRYEDVLVDMVLEVWDMAGAKIWEKKYEGVRVLADSVAAIDLVSVGEILATPLSDAVMHVRVLCGEEHYDNYGLFGTFKDMHIMDPEVSYVREGDNLVFRCTRPAFGVHIAADEEGSLSDDFFTLVPSVIMRVKCPSDRVHVTSLYDYLNKAGANLESPGTPGDEGDPNVRPRRG
ncbi:MAG: glycoside hydrolase family 2 protein [Candidatus Cryosericum sp.]